ncbi:MAG: hypothetical protein EZS28_036549 [Streblomastix strix]|uniref:Uncharacterized protein n=1 Tax=Streblomastix strix TaxID=222440 RepID=A0A5J4UAQ5_9EUKA|nr:MAG: hypothetical protein EZS28_036549 [Streblomastix strix]
MLQTIYVVYMEHPKMIFQVANAMIEQILNGLPLNMRSGLRITEVRVTVAQPRTQGSRSKQEKDDLYSSKARKADVLRYIAWTLRLQHLMETLFSILNVSIALHAVPKNRLGSISGTSSGWIVSSMIHSSVP